MEVKPFIIWNGAILIKTYTRTRFYMHAVKHPLTVYFIFKFNFIIIHRNENAEYGFNICIVRHGMVKNTKNHWSFYTKKSYV